MTRRRYPLQLLIGSALTTAATGYGVTQATQGRPWWLLAPGVLFGLLGLELWRLVRREKRDVQLARIVDLNKLPATDAVDLTELDLDGFDCMGRWGGTPWERYEDETGERR